jgi:hypothetical protein
MPKETQPAQDLLRTTGNPKALPCVMKHLPASLPRCRQPGEQPVVLLRLRCNLIVGDSFFVYTCLLKRVAGWREGATKVRNQTDVIVDCMLGANHRANLVKGKRLIKCMTNLERAER